MTYKVTVRIEAGSGEVASFTDNDVQPKDLSYMLGGIPLIYSIPLSRQLRDQFVDPARFKELS